MSLGLGCRSVMQRDYVPSPGEFDSSPSLQGPLTWVKGMTILQACGEHPRFPRQDFESWVAGLARLSGPAPITHSAWRPRCRGASPRRAGGPGSQGRLVGCRARTVSQQLCEDAKKSRVRALAMCWGWGAAQMPAMVACIGVPPLWGIGALRSFAYTLLFSF